MVLVSTLIVDGRNIAQMTEDSCVGRYGRGIVCDSAVVQLHSSMLKEAPLPPPAPGKQETPHLKTPPPYLSWTHCCLENIITIRTRGHVIVLQELQVTLNTPASVSAKFCKSRDSDNLSCVVVTR